MMNDKEPGKIRIGIVGLGGHGRTIQSSIECCSDFEVVAVCDTVAEERSASAERFGCFAASTMEELLAHGGMDAVAINTPNHLHLQQVTDALNAGLHVFVEKPIANSMADGLKMVEQAEEKGLTMMVAHHMRFNRASRKVKQLLEAGELGEIVSMEMHYSANNTPYYPPDAWRLQPEYCPLLPVTQLGIHGVDLVHYFMSRISDVYAVARSVTVKPPVKDSVTAVMHTEDGPIVTLTSNYCSPVLFECRFAMTKRNIIYTPHSVAISPENGMQGADEDWTHFDYHDNERDGYEIEVTVFADALLRGADVQTDGRVGLQALAVDECMRKSIESSGVVSVPDFVSPVGSFSK
ncbi:MAG: Gfo/Idh/MocA family oxidoreductase [Rhodothermales bacterium]|nr:Gfo/Idh/MocA family oxidoreductase [Rhodothermales bacterium]